jgi:SAM-dependent methyltransferase
MFALSATDLSGRVLDCSAGAAGFVAEAAARGISAVAVDPAYALPRAAIVDAARADLERGSAIVDRFPDRFVWDWYGSRERRDAMRRRAVSRFVADLSTQPARYVAGALPRLPFRNRSFDVVLCSHLLFTWADALGFDWHLAALLELARVGAQVRVFPTVVQGAGEPVPFWDELVAAAAAAGVRTALRRVDYRFQVSGDQLLVAAAADGASGAGNGGGVPP